MQSVTLSRDDTEEAQSHKDRAPHLLQVSSLDTQRVLSPRPPLRLKSAAVMCSLFYSWCQKLILTAAVFFFVFFTSFCSFTRGVNCGEVKFYGFCQEEEEEEEEEEEVSL